MTKVFLLRHAKAGDRSRWDGDDELRPLTPNGWKQAEALVNTFAGAGVKRVISSPYVRCRQSVQPFAERAKLPVELSDAIVEGAPVDDTMALIDKVSLRNTVLATHGDVMQNVIDWLASRGVDVDEEGGLEKGSIWVLRVRGGAITSARYVPAP